MQVEIVRHHRGAEYSDSDIQHRGVSDYLRPRNEPGHHGAKRRMGKNDLDQKANADCCDESDDERLEHSESLILEIENKHRVERGKADAYGKRYVEQEIQRDR